VIAVGSELLLFGRSDTNGDWIARRLALRGVDVGRRTIVGDDEREIAEAITRARGRAALLIVTGGLGPTVDDVTREALARSLGAPLETDERVREALIERIRVRGYKILDSADRQARHPRGCELLRNPVGSAPGLLHRGPPCWTLVLPGVPGEMRAMFDEAAAHLDVLPATGAPFARFLVGGLPESEVDDRVGDLIGRSDTARVTILAAEGGVELHVLGTGPDRDAARAEVDRIAEEIRVRLGPLVGARGEETLAAVVVRRLAERGETLAVAESCTGGLLGGAITSVPGSSSAFLGGIVAYSNAVKIAALGIDPGMVEREGAVSEPVARAMAEGVRTRMGADWALAVTGIAGPDGGTESKPVGLVWIAAASAAGTLARRLMLGGDRAAIRARSVSAALELLRRALTGESA
jgi:nicotinamide-nucleotide amidase